MSVNLFSLETLTGLILGLLLGFFIKNVFKKKEDLGSYSSNLETLTETLKEYQDAIDGLVLVADSEPDKNGYTKKVVIKTDVNDESILVQAGFDGSKIRLWNNGIIYDELFTKDELGKFSTVWDKINTNFLKNDLIVPITEPDKIQNEIENAINKFIEEGLESGYVKKMRVK